jgi:hypothetical protein
VTDITCVKVLAGCIEVSVIKSVLAGRVSVRSMKDICVSVRAGRIEVRISAGKVRVCVGGYDISVAVAWGKVRVCIGA